LRCKRDAKLLVDKERDMGVSSGRDQHKFEATGRTLGRWAACVLLALTLSGCDQLGIDTPAKIEERVVAESKAVGGACRHAMRAIEDCYSMNPKAQKAAIADGWREMDEYMRENKLEGVTPTIAKALPRGARRSQDEEDEPEDTDTEAATSEDAAASKAKAHAGKETEGDKSAKAANGADAPTKVDKADKTEKTDKAERGADNKTKRDKRDTLHAEAASSQPH